MVLLCLFCGVPRGFATRATQEICAGLHGGRAAVSEGWHVVCVVLVYILYFILLQLYYTWYSEYRL